jgi:signal transduction histidine kinase
VSEGAARAPHSVLAPLFALVGLVACAIAFALAPHDKLTDPLTIVLAGCVLSSAFLLVELEGRVFWGGALIPHICAFSLLGPAPAALVGIVEEGAVWSADRYRLRVLPINLLGAVAPNITAALAIDALVAGQGGLLFYGAVALAAVGAVLMNVLLVTSLVALLYGDGVRDSLRANVGILPAIAIPIAVAVAAVALFRSEGLGATAFVVAGVLIFGYVTRRLAAEREQHDRISTLAASRGRLVAQVLEAEDRERRALAEALHDDVVQTLLVVRQDLSEAQSQASLGDALARLDETLDQLRGAIKTTHPSVLECVGLEVALTTLAEVSSAGGRLRPHVEVQADAAGYHDRLIFSLARELLTNTAKHAAAESVVVRVTRNADDIQLEVTDDGRGFGDSALGEPLAEGHIGLQVATERVEGVGGSLEVDAAHTPGARVVIALPIETSTPGAAVSPAEVLTSVGEH